MATEEMEAPAVAAPAPASPLRARSRRPSIRRLLRHPRPALRRLHKWVALTVGTLLLLVAVSGSILLLHPEIDQVIHPGMYVATKSSHPVSAAQAIAAVDRALPGFEAKRVIRSRGVYVVAGKDDQREAHVDPGSGRVLGTEKYDGGFFGFVENLHTCALSCKDQPGYIAALDHKIPLFGNDDLTVGTLILAVLGLVLLFMLGTGIVLWWPGVRRIRARGFKVRRGRSGYARQYDLHKVIGAVALPFLAMWAITGTGFELKQVKDLWYDAFGGRPAEAAAFESKPDHGRSVSLDQAQAIALRAVPGARWVSVESPGADKKGYYDLWVAKGIDPYHYGNWAGGTEVAVDRYSGRSAVLENDPSKPRALSAVIWDDWSSAVHFGYPVGWIPRTVWVAFGLTPLMLAFTGVAMVVVKRRKRRRKLPGERSE